MIRKGLLNLREFKSWAERQLPRDSTLRDFILSEPDELSIEAVLAKIPIWFKQGKKEAVRLPSHLVTH